LTVQAPASSAKGRFYCRTSAKSLSCSLEHGPQLRRICVLTAQLHQLDPLFCKFGGGTPMGILRLGRTRYSTKSELVEVQSRLKTLEDAFQASQIITNIFLGAVVSASSVNF
jgi:hypothetical protein